MKAKRRTIIPITKRQRAKRSLIASTVQQSKTLEVGKTLQSCINTVVKHCDSRHCPQKYRDQVVMPRKESEFGGEHKPFDRHTVFEKS